MPVARVGDRLRHLVPADAEGPARFREAGRVEGVAAVQAREGGLDDLLREAKEKEEREEGGHEEGIICRLVCGFLVARPDRRSSE